MKLAVLLVALLATAPAHAALRYAVIVGNNLGTADDEPLRWAEQDARRALEVLVELGGVAKERAILLLGGDAAEVRRQLVRVHGQLEEAERQGYRTELLFFYSGHGDAEALHLSGAALPLGELRGALRAMPADTIVAIVDACRTGAFRRKGVAPAPAFDIAWAREQGPRGRVFITSAAADESAQESDRLRGSFFTHHLLSGLRGAADGDGDGRVTLTETYAYAYRRTLQASHGETRTAQHPEMSVELGGEGEVVMATLARADAALLLSPELEGDLLVVDDHSGRVVAELRKPAGTQARLAVPSGRYRLQLRQPKRLLAGEVPVEWGGSAVVGHDLLEEQPLGLAAEKGTRLDPRPWRLAVQGTFGSPVLLGPSSAAGALVAVERAVLEAPLLARLAVGWTQSRAGNGLWRYRHDELSLSVGLGARAALGVLHAALVAYGGLRGVVEHGARVDGARLATVSDAATETRGLRVGPLLGVGLDLHVPLGGAWSLVTAASVEVTWLRASGELRHPSGWRAGLGVARAL